MSWKATREGYASRVRLADASGQRVVPVLARDLEYMLQELNELDRVRELLALGDVVRGAKS